MQTRSRQISKNDKDLVKSNSKKKKINDTLKNAKNLYIKNPYATEFQNKKFESYSTTNKNVIPNNILFNNGFNNIK